MKGRGLVPGLPTPHPVADLLPPLYQEDDLAMRLSASFDAVLAPIFATLDNLEWYFSPTFAPADFLGYLAGWVGLEVDQNWTIEQQRRFVTEAVELFRWRGTAHGLAALVRIYTGGEAEIVENGGASWSATPGGDPPGSSERALTVRVYVDQPDDVDRRRLESIVAFAKPAHMPHRIEVMSS